MSVRDPNSGGIRQLRERRRLIVARVLVAAALAVPALLKTVGWRSSLDDIERMVGHEPFAVWLLGGVIVAELVVSMGIARGRSWAPYVCILWGGSIVGFRALTPNWPKSCHCLGFAAPSWIPLVIAAGCVVASWWIVKQSRRPLLPAAACAACLLLGGLAGSGASIVGSRTIGDYLVYDSPRISLREQTVRIRWRAHTSPPVQVRSTCDCLRVSLVDVDRSARIARVSLTLIEEIPRDVRPVLIIGSAGGAATLVELQWDE